MRILLREDPKKKTFILSDSFESFIFYNKDSQNQSLIEELQTKTLMLRGVLSDSLIDSKYGTYKELSKVII
jgi:hypothetical protein